MCTQRRGPVSHESKLCVIVFRVELASLRGVRGEGLRELAKHCHYRQMDFTTPNNTLSRGTHSGTTGR